MGLAFVIAAAIAGLALGAIIGWLYAGRESAAAKQTVDSLRSQLDGVVAERDSARAGQQQTAIELAALQADARNFEQRMKDLTESKDALIAQFREVGDKLLEKAHKDFLEKAGEKFSSADQQSQAKLKELLAPVETTLKRYEEGLQRVEKERIDQYAGLKSVVEQVREGQGQVRDEARRLTTALTSAPKMRGDWGEQSLKNLLEQAGLSPYVDFQTQVSVGNEEGRFQPDVIVRLPGGRKLVIDAKCSLNAYREACDEVDDEQREKCLQALVTSIKTLAQQLASKAYWAQFDDAADYVIMYIPGEHFLVAALDQDFKDSKKNKTTPLWDWAFERRVLLATPTNLVAIAKTVASIWNQEKLAAEAGKIAVLGRELHSRLATMAEHVASVGTNLSRANNAYNKMVGSLESQVFTQARRFEELGAGSSKDIPEPPVIESSPRTLTKLASKSDEPVVVTLDNPSLPHLKPVEADESDD
jgi:DNA recombination protein RmuC